MQSGWPRSSPDLDSPVKKKRTSAIGSEPSGQNLGPPVDGHYLYGLGAPSAEPSEWTAQIAAGTRLAASTSWSQRTCEKCSVNGYRKQDAARSGPTPASLPSLSSHSGVIGITPQYYLRSHWGNLSVDPIERKIKDRL
jgi:hypothetical protein